MNRSNASEVEFAFVVRSVENGFLILVSECDDSLALPQPTWIAGDAIELKDTAGKVFAERIDSALSRIDRR